MAKKTKKTIFGKPKAPKAPVYSHDKSEVAKDLEAVKRAAKAPAPPQAEKSAYRVVVAGALMPAKKISVELKSDGTGILSFDLHKETTDNDYLKTKYHDKAVGTFEASSEGPASKIVFEGAYLRYGDSPETDGLYRRWIVRSGAWRIKYYE